MITKGAAQSRTGNGRARRHRARRNNASNVGGRQGEAGKVRGDAYLVAFAEAAGLTNVSFDRGFADYSGVRPLILG